MHARKFLTLRNLVVPSLGLPLAFFLGVANGDTYNFEADFAVPGVYTNTSSPSPVNIVDGTFTLNAAGTLTSLSMTFDGNPTFGGSSFNATNSGNGPLSAGTAELGSDCGGTSVAGVACELQPGFWFEYFTVDYGPPFAFDRLDISLPGPGSLPAEWITAVGTMTPGSPIVPTPAPPAWLLMLTGLAILSPFYRQHVKFRRKSFEQGNVLAV